MDNLALNILRLTDEPLKGDDLWLLVDRLYRPTRDYYDRVVDALVTVGLLHLSENGYQRNDSRRSLDYVFGINSIKPEEIKLLKQFAIDAPNQPL